MVFTYFSSDIDRDDQIEEDWRDEDDKVDNILFILCSCNNSCMLWRDL